MGIVPPPIASVSVAELVFASWVQHSLKRNFESEVLPDLFNQFIDFVNTKKRASVVSSVSSAPVALGAPPPDISFFPQPEPTPRLVWRGVLVPLLIPNPFSGIDRRLVALP